MGLVLSTVSGVHWESCIPCRQGGTTICDGGNGRRSGCTDCKPLFLSRYYSYSSINRLSKWNIGKFNREMTSAKQQTLKLQALVPPGRHQTTKNWAKLTLPGLWIEGLHQPSEHPVKKKPHYKGMRFGAIFTRACLIPSPAQPGICL